MGSTSARQRIRDDLTPRAALATTKVLLVPYCERHVPTYHSWMQDPDLQAATASEPLTLVEEHSMQRSWRQDRDKLTFIVCLPLSYEHRELHSIAPDLRDSNERMIGDINLFLFESEPDEPSDSDRERKDNMVIGEIELMIARKDLQRNGYGRAALLTFMQYVIVSWSQISGEYSSAVSGGSDSSPTLAYLRAKINEANVRSIRLFESVGFEQCRDGANFFGELELRWNHNIAQLKSLEQYELPKRLTYGGA